MFDAFACVAFSNLFSTSHQTLIKNDLCIFQDVVLKHDMVFFRAHPHLDYGYTHLVKQDTVIPYMAFHPASNTLMFSSFEDGDRDELWACEVWSPECVSPIDNKGRKLECVDAKGMIVGLAFEIDPKRFYYQPYAIEEFTNLQDIPLQQGDTHQPQQLVHYTARSSSSSSSKLTKIRFTDV
jgi:hypothetical protein